MSANSEKLSEAMDKVKMLRSRLRGRILQRDTFVLDLLMSKTEANGGSSRRQEDTQSRELELALQELETLKSELKKTSDELEQKKKECFHVRLG